MRPTRAQRRKMMEMAGVPPSSRAKMRVRPRPEKPTTREIEAGEGLPARQVRLRRFAPDTYKRYALIVNKVYYHLRNKFRVLSRPDTYFEIKRGNVGDRVAYSVELNEREAEVAFADAEYEGSNLQHIEPVSGDLPASNSVTPGVVPMRYHRANHANNMDLTGAGVRIGSIDTGISSEIASLMGSKIFTSQGFQGLDPLDYCPPTAVYPQAHGSQMTPIACPPKAKIAIAGTGDEDGLMYTDTTAAAMNWLADEVGVHIIYVEVAHAASTVVAEAVASAAARGVIVLAAAGNDGHGLDHSPATDPGCLAIAAYSATTDARMSYSNYGDHIWAAACCGPGVWYNPDASSNAFDDSDGGTSTAVAIASDLFARRMTGGKSAAEVKSMMQRMARRTGAPSIYEGHGVLRLPKPLATTTRYNSDVDAPADEVQPTTDPTDGQWKTRGQEDPEPTYDPAPTPGDPDPKLAEDPVPDSGVNQAGNSEGGQFLEDANSALQEQLRALIEAVNLDPSVANGMRLIDFIEEHTGQDIASYFGNDWDALIADGVSRTETIAVVGTSVQLTLGGELMSSASCAHLPTKTMSLPQRDFVLPSVPLASNPSPPSPPTTGNSTYVTTDVLPDAEIHLQHPRLMWLEDTVGGDGDLIGRWNSGASVTVAGTTYYTYIQVRYTYTARVMKKVSHAWDFFGLEWIDTASYLAVHPLMAMSTLSRFVPGSGSPDSDDPVRVGTLGGPGEVADTDFFTEDYSPSDYTDNAWLPHNFIPGNPGLNFDGASPEEIQDAVDTYMASKSPYDPPVSYFTDDEGYLCLTYDHSTRDTALYIPNSCSSTQTLALLINYGGWLHEMGNGAVLLGYPGSSPNSFEGLMARVLGDTSDVHGAIYTDFEHLAPAQSGDYAPRVEAAEITSANEGRKFPFMQPDPEFGSPVPSPGSPDPTVPLGGPEFPVNGRATFDPDAPPLFEADWPFDEPPPIGDPFEFTPPDPFPDTPFEPPDFYPPTFNAPISDFNFKTPSFDPCNFGMPDFGGDICGPSGVGDTDMPSEGSPFGGTDNMPGDFGGTPTGGGGGDIGGVGGIGGGAGGYNPGPDGMDPDSELPGGSKYLDEERCYQDELATSIITEMAMELGLDESKIIINPDGVACDETYTGCFPAGTNKFDILKKMAALCGYGVIDTGGGVIIQPPSPNNVHHYLDNYHNIFFLERINTDVDLYHHVEVFRPPLVRNGVIIKPAVSKIALVDTPFTPDETSVKYIRETDYNLTDQQIQNIANLEAGKVGGLGSQVQVTTLWRDGYKYALYDQLHLRRYDRGWFTDWKIRHIEHMFTDDGNLTIAQASWIGYDPTPALPAPVDTSQALRPQLANYG